MRAISTLLRYREITNKRLTKYRQRINYLQRKIKQLESANSVLIRTIQD